MRPQKSAFTLIELLVVVIIIGILTAILIPAVQYGRESARRMTCQNNLRQLGLGLQQYESAHKELPPGTLGSSRQFILSSDDFPGWENDVQSPFYLHNNQNTSWLVFLLPYVEQNSLAMRLPAICTNYQMSYKKYKELNANAPSTILDDEDVQEAMRESFSLLYCPADDLESEVLSPNRGPNRGGSQPAFYTDLDNDYFIAFDIPHPIKGTNYSACSGASSGGYYRDQDRRIFDGAFACRIRKKMTEVRDGASHSIALGETLGRIYNQERIRMAPWMFAMMCRARSDMEWMTTVCIQIPDLELLGNGKFAYETGIASKHAPGVNVVFLDGSVRLLGRDIDVMTLYALSGIADGEVVDYSE